MDKPKPKTPRDDTWTEEQDRMTNPNRRQEEDEAMNVESPPNQKRATNKDQEQGESKPSDRRDESQRGNRPTDRVGGRHDQTE